MRKTWDLKYINNIEINITDQFILKFFVVRIQNTSSGSRIYSSFEAAKLQQRKAELEKKKQLQKKVAVSIYIIVIIA